MNPNVRGRVKINSMIPTAPHGRELVNLLVERGRAAELRAMSREWLSWDLTERQMCDLELLLNGGFSPLRGYLGEAEYDSVCTTMRLLNGALWPIPITLDVSEALAERLRPGAWLALRDMEGVMLAALEVQELWRPDRELEAERVLGTASPEHPGAAFLRHEANPWYVSGKLEGLQLPVHHDFRALRANPAELRERFARHGWRRIAAFQTRNPLHRAHFEMTLRASRTANANLLLHPVVGMTKPGDVDYYTRVRCYQSVLSHYPANSAELALLPLAMRMAGPREALWHAIIRKNFGCTHFIIGRDHAGPGKDSSGRAFYQPYDAQNLLLRHALEIGIEALPFRMMAYVPDLDTYLPEDELDGNPENAARSRRSVTISGTELRRKLGEGRDIPEWFTFPEVANELQRRYPPRWKQGLTIFFTGLSGSGKSTLARILQIKLLERGGRNVTLLDGDLIRKHLSSELGFSKEHRDLNIRRIGWVASEITKNGGIALCAPIAPYDAVRKQVRTMVETYGAFVLVHVATPIELCEQRDRKGLYAKARAGLLPQFTGISDPYETPADAEVVMDTAGEAPEESVARVLTYLERENYLPISATAVETVGAAAGD